MPKVIGKKLLCSCEKKYFKSEQGIGEHSIFKRFNVLENLIKTKVDKKYLHFLTQPILENNTILWYGSKYDQEPKLFKDLSVDEYAKYKQIKNETISHFNNVINRLRQEEKSSEVEIFEKALKFVNEDFIYCYDNKVVLGIWGMQLRDEVRESIGLVMKPLFLNKSKTNPENVFIIRFISGIEGQLIGDSEINKKNNSIILPNEVPEVKVNEGFEFLGWDKDPENFNVTTDEVFIAQYSEIERLNDLESFTINFNSGEYGEIIGDSVLTKTIDSTIFVDDIPKIKPTEGYEFSGWDKDPINFNVNSNTTFSAEYQEKPAKIIPWYNRFWYWLIGLFSGGCLRWLLWLFMILLFSFLFCWLFRNCSKSTLCGECPSPIVDKPELIDDPNSGSGGIYNPGYPYTPVPTPPEYHNILPPEKGVLEPIDSTEIVRRPGKPVIIGNRLNILMENKDKSIIDLAKAFKIKFPDEKYKVVYYDDVVKRMQIEIPNKEREKLKQEIPNLFQPNYELFVFDEALFERRHTPNDPAFADPDKSWYLRVINAPNAWDITLGSNKVTIAIVDNGFNLHHPELSNKVVMPYNVWTHSDKVYPQAKDHGTHVAGTALATIDNNQGSCGIAPNSAFMPIQVANNQGIMTTTSVLDGVLYALYQGADVINISLGTEFEGTLPASQQKDLQDNHFKEEERLWKEIMKIADQHKAVIVIAAGNDNMLAGVDPLNRPKNFISVSAVDKNLQEFNKAGFSNYGSFSTISAPGIDIYSTVGNNEYKVMSGTSMAAPIVSGSVALMKSLNSDITAEEVICILQSTGKTTNSEIGKLLQIDKALEKTQSKDYKNCQDELEKPSSGDVQILLSWNNYNDLDLHCVDPNNDKVWYKNKVVPSGGILEIDMNAGGSHTKSPIENIFWPTNGAPQGTYHVYLNFYKKKEIAIENTPYTITVKYGDSTKVFKGSINEKGEMRSICSFTLGETNTIVTPPTQDDDNPSNSSDLEELKRKSEELKRQLEEIEREMQRIKRGNN